MQGAVSRPFPASLLIRPHLVPIFNKQVGGSHVSFLHRGRERKEIPEDDSQGLVSSVPSVWCAPQDLQASGFIVLMAIREVWCVNIPFGY